MLPGSQQNPLTSSSFQTSQMMLSSKNIETFPKEFYVETNTLAFATQTTDQDIFTMNFKIGSHYHKSFIFRETITSEKYDEYATNSNVLGLWDVPHAIFQKPILE